MNVGIDKINFYVPPYYVNMVELAQARAVDPNKFLIGIGQSEMAVSPKTQDIVTFATNAAKEMLTKEDLASIDMIIVGTESSIDESKASAVVLHRLLGIQPFARSFEIKEACYGATAGVQMAKNHVALNPNSKVLVIASDVARYGLKSGGEPTQGAGAVAILISQNPRLLVLEEENLSFTQDIYDFWRPIGYDYPLVDGPLSNETYVQAFQKVWQEYQKRYERTLKDFSAFSFHIPYTKMGKKALLSILETETSEEQTRLLEQYEASICYSRRVGNLYTGSLYLGFISLLENSKTLKEGDRIGFFSYGSGSVAELFSGKLVKNYHEHLNTQDHQKLLNQRQALSIREYEQMFEDSLDIHQSATFADPTPYSIIKIENTIREYRES
ncbi:hydroxymethylglutaryl-CoA synthase [Enterococcus lemanii]|uniref:Hydroxymethylglutaryl-CoA synthase n=1 Tax=Enterococcus lemanii TaxID=1159752 RepID=A0ABV9MSE6_9ENTE|nr:hydroxymethylglutaryl-CoA synthase [Enterococcus lemanii]MBM7709335.1 hydroxymethylglutaryl-CoA synthase [Enterococcus lemanii]